MEKTNLTEVQSLELITSMIQDSRARLARNSGTPFLIWGYTTIAVSLFNALAVYMQWSGSWGWSWFAIPVVGWVGMMIFNKNEPSAHNYIDRVISIIWATLGVSFAWIFLAALIYHCSIEYLTILTMGVGTVITGLILKNRATVICGCGAMITSLLYPIIYFAISKGVIDAEAVIALASFWRWGSKIAFALIFLFMMVIPGHILNNKYKQKSDEVCSKS